jgi:drug/metabolite transporter (DMT)-like permease
MSDSVLVLACAVAGYSILSISQAGQKVGLHRIPHAPVHGWGIWALATTGTAVSFFLVLVAIGIGSVALVGAMTGTGMAALTVFSHYILHEHVGRREVLAVSAIALGAGLAGAVPLGTGGSPRTTILYWALGIVLFTYGVIATVAGKTHWRGVILGGLAGSLAAFSQLFQKLGTLSLSLDDGFAALVIDLVTNRPILTSVVITVVSMLVAQLAYTRGQAIRIIPSYTAHASAVPVVGGVVVFDEKLEVLHWLGIALLFVGTMSLVLTPGRRRSEAA